MSDMGAAAGMAAGLFGFDASALIQGLDADLAAGSALADVSQAAAGQFQVDLAALYQHHGLVCDVYDRLGKKVVSLQQAGAENSYPASEIPGVQKALEATWGNATDSGNSMIEGLQAVLGRLATYANAVADVYMSYIKADTSGASTLTAAGNPDAASVTIP